MFNYDSRFIQPGDTFLCLPGGDAYIEEAYSNGAIDVISMTRTELGAWSREHYNHPSGALSVVGITGTNGKTSVSFFVNEALNTLGYSSIVQGTLNARLTTPESFDTLKRMKHHVDNKGSHFIMEVSSHAIDQNRIAGIDFDVVCLTNISQDHLDYHKTFEAYKQTKLSFMATANAHALFPDTFCSYDDIINDSIYGDFNQDNLRAALGILIMLGIPEQKAREALSCVSAPPGRFEKVQGSHPFSVFIDYAHTPDGLDRVLNTAKKIATQQHGRLLTCFGCGGDRDRLKRPLMAKAASSYSDYIVITQDNPRTENPDQIIHDILAGLDHQDMIVKHDRHAAIQHILTIAQPNDCVVIAGKGHENMQILHDKTIEFDDKLVSEKILKTLGYV